jgi:ammonia channel protein AmtB
MFAVITGALLSGAIADRARFWPWALFVGLWTLVIHVPEVESDGIDEAEHAETAYDLTPLTSSMGCTT